MSNDARFLPNANNAGKISRHGNVSRLPDRRRKPNYREIDWLGLLIIAAVAVGIVVVFGETLKGVW